MAQISLADVAGLRGGKLMSGPSSPDTGAVLVISKGDQPTAGYAFRFRDFEVSEGSVTLNLAWVTPAPDSMQAQVVTNPCIVLGVTGQIQGQVAIFVDGEPLGTVAPG